MKSKWMPIVVVLLVLGLLAASTPWLLKQAGYFLRVEERLGKPTDTHLDFDAAEDTKIDATENTAIENTATESTATENTATEAEKNEGAVAHNVILLLGDGMGFSQLIGARYALLGPNGRLELERFPVTGWSVTHSARELYTDSAAGATALASGIKTRPSSLGVDAEGEPVPTLLELVVAAGKSAGLVTDSYFVDASPSAFVAHQPSRREYSTIVESMAGSGALLIYGEHRPYFEQKEGWAEAMAAMDAAGYVDITTAEELAAVPSDTRVLGRFDSGSIADPDRTPHLPDLAADALARLSRDPDGFFLFVETEETDSYSHNGEFDRMVQGVASLDRVAKLAVDFARGDGRTLVLATADHDTGGLAILGGEHGEPIRVRWATGSHTAEPVPLLAFGAGAERFAGVRDNTEVGRLLRDVLGLGDPEDAAEAP